METGTGSHCKHGKRIPTKNPLYSAFYIQLSEYLIYCREETINAHKFLELNVLEM